MHIIINGQHRDLEQIVTIRDLLAVLQLTGRLAVEINSRIIPRSRYSEHALQDGDRIEIVHAIGGG